MIFWRLKIHIQKYSLAFILESFNLSFSSFVICWGIAIGHQGLSLKWKKIDRLKLCRRRCIYNFLRFCLSNSCYTDARDQGKEKEMGISVKILHKCENLEKFINRYPLGLGLVFIQITCHVYDNHEQRHAWLIVLCGLAYENLIQISWTYSSEFTFRQSGKFSDCKEPLLSQLTLTGIKSRENVVQIWIKLLGSKESWLENSFEKGEDIKYISMHHRTTQNQTEVWRMKNAFLWFSKKADNILHWLLLQKLAANIK